MIDSGLGLTYKTGVSPAGAEDRLLYALQSADAIYSRFGVPLTVTSMTEGRHMGGSLHYQGLAADLRTRDLPPGNIGPIADELRRTLGPDWDVLLEGDHIHMEFDPSGGGGGWPGEPVYAGDPGAGAGGGLIQEPVIFFGDGTDTLYEFESGYGPEGGGGIPLPLILIAGAALFMIFGPQNRS